MSGTVITFGTFDLFHVGHLNILKRASSFGDKLVVGVSSDLLNVQKKNRAAVFSQDERIAIVSALRFVDEVFLEQSLEEKQNYITSFGARTLVMGDDWIGKFDFLREFCNVVYLPRTPAISTTATVEAIIKYSSKHKLKNFVATNESRRC